MKRLYVVRHCSAEGQSPAAPLTPEGRKQAECLSSFLEDKQIDSIISSPYVRAISSIEPLAEALHLDVQADFRLSERVLSSEPLDNWRHCLQRTFEDFTLAYHGGETSGRAMERAVELVEEVFSGNDRNVVLVTHGNLMTLLLKHFDQRFGFQQWASLTNPDVYMVTVGGTQSVVERVWA